MIGENRKLLLFPLAEVPELARGRGVILQRYKDGDLLDAATFTWKEGFKDQNNRTWTPSRTQRLESRARAGGQARAARVCEEREVRVNGG